MNTRLQVEHPVTEFVTGIDLVHWQFRIAAGEPLTLLQKDIRWRGSAIECRLYAEDPDHGFFPSPGTITSLALPSGPGVRVDSGVYSGWTVPMDYDPLLAKLVVYANTRQAALSRLRRAISESHVGGIASNLPFFHSILRDPEFCSGEIHTGFLDGWLQRRSAGGDEVDAEVVAAIAAVAQAAKSAPARLNGGPKPDASRSQWLLSGRNELLR